MLISDIGCDADENKSTSTYSIDGQQSNGPFHRSCTKWKIQAQFIQRYPRFSDR